MNTPRANEQPKITRRMLNIIMVISEKRALLLELSYFQETKKYDSYGTRRPSATSKDNWVMRGGWKDFYENQSLSPVLIGNCS